MQILFTNASALCSPRSTKELYIYVHHFAMKTFFGLLFTFCACFTTAQPHETYKLEPNGTVCANTLQVYTDGTYVYQTACETSPQLSFGRWIKTKDVIKLEPVDPKTYTVIKSVSAATVAGDSIWLTVVDKNGVNVSAKISVGLEVSGRGSYLFGNDTSGTKKFVYKRSGGKIVFRTLNKLFGQRLELPADTANNFVVTLNLSADWLTSTHAEWSNPPSLLFLKKGDDLSSAASSAQRVVFRKQIERQ